MTQIDYAGMQSGVVAQSGRSEPIVKPREIDDMIGQLFDVVDGLEDRATKLEERFGKVLRPLGADISKVPDNAPTGVELADTLNAAVGRLRILSSRLTDLHGRAAL